ncbi:hypothetical protein NMG60_11016669 [Bertholletia excelsa]
MVSSEVDNLVYDMKLSSVVPGRVTGEDKVRELTGADMAVRLHYIRGLYFFHVDAVGGLDIFALKKPMFQWLDLHYPASGRIRRRPEGGDGVGVGWPFIKCNDGGVRIVEASCRKTLDDWLAMEERSSLDRFLVSDQVLGPELDFSPLVFIQFTRFQCGGLSVGLSWAHVLGDAFSASAFMNMWGAVIAGHIPLHPLKLPNTENPRFPAPPSRQPISLKRVDPVGDQWIAANKRKMEVLSFRVSTKKLDLLLSESFGQNPQEYFNVIAALMWKSVARVRRESELRVVTICRNASGNREGEILSNSQVIGVVESDSAVGKVELLELAKLIHEELMDERIAIEELLERENEGSDFILYGANLTFVNMEEANVYGLQLLGKKPIFANYAVSGVGEEGVVLVLPGPEADGQGGSRTVTAVVPENEIAELKTELEKEWGIVRS